MNLSEDWLERGFQLACFLVDDRQAAILVLTRAMNKLKTQCKGERKKNYWRDKYLKRRITRIAKGDCDTLQWLIYFESDHLEQEEERSHGCTHRDLVVRYIKCLVQTTTGMSSFYVNIGLNRLFYNYTTAELQKLYESLTQQYLGPDEYRRGKGVLMDRLQSRFRKFLTTTRTDHGELRFVPADDQDRWAQLAQDCLTAFTPWSTAGACLVPAGFDSLSQDLSRLFSDKRHQKIDQNAIEINRCHAFIEPGCFTRLSEGLYLGPPGAKLALPRFSMKNDNKNDNEDIDRAERPSQFPPLTEQERRKIRHSVGAEADRRQSAIAQSLRVMVDGVEAARLLLDRERSLSFEVTEGAKLVEILTEYEGQDLLLATHLITYKDWQGVVPSSATLVLKGAGQLDLVVSPTEQQGGVRSAGLSVSFLPVENKASEGTSFSIFSWRFGAVPVLSLVATVLIALGWTLNSMSLHRQLQDQSNAAARVQNELSQEKAARAALEQKPATVVAPPEPVPYKLFADEGFTRGEGNSPMPVVQIPFHPGLINLHLPLDQRVRRTYRAVLTLFAGREEILSQNLLTPIRSAAGSIIVFLLPSNLLQNRQDYTVHLSQRRGPGAFDEINSFSFHVK